MSKLLTAGMATLCCLAVLAAPASAKKHAASEYDYIATIACGHGKSMTVGSGVDTTSPLVDLKTGRKLLPAEWHIAYDGGTYDEVVSPAPVGRRITCRYDDGFATGIVIVVRAGTVNGRDDD